MGLSIPLGNILESKEILAYSYAYYLSLLSHVQTTSPVYYLPTYSIY